MLTVEQLEHLKDLCARVGAPVAQRLRPGLSDREMDAYTDPLGIHLPPEGRTWWGWHDGAGPPDPLTAIHVGGAMPLLPLASAVAAHKNRRTLLDTIAPHYPASPEEYWPLPWLCVTARDGDFILLDCEPTEHASPIHCVSSTSLAPRPQQQAASFGELIDIWITAIETGAWRFDPDTQRFFSDWERLPPELQFSPLL